MTRDEREMAAIDLHAAIVRMASLLSTSAAGRGFAMASGDMPAFRLHDRAELRRYKALLRLVRALTELAGGVR